MHAATRALVDQASAATRDYLDYCGVNPYDPDQRRAMRAVWYWVAAHQHILPLVLEALGDQLDGPPTPH